MSWEWSERTALLLGRVGLKERRVPLLEQLPQVLRFLPRRTLDEHVLAYSEHEARRAFHGGSYGCMKSRSLRKHDMRLDGGKLGVMTLTFGLCSSMNYIADAWRTNDSETLWLFSGLGVVLAVTLLWELTRAPKAPRAAEGIVRTEDAAKCSR